MRTSTAQLGRGNRCEDRILVTENAVLVLDGATAFEPVDLDPGEYAESLAKAVGTRLTRDPEVPIGDAVADGIAAVARERHLEPGRSPSSTVAVLRVRGGEADLYVLGDSPIHYGVGAEARVLRDDRMSAVARSERAAYTDALRAGGGFDEAHRGRLGALQRAQRAWRNTAGGYWTAETDPAAAHHAITVTLGSEAIRWAVLGTDGATDLIEDGDPEWAAISRYSDDQLDALVRGLYRWEREVDPSGRLLPRAHRHDDKSLAVVPQLF